MYANITTEYARTFKAVNGAKFMLPGSFPNAEERAAIARLWKEQGVHTPRGIFAMHVEEMAKGIISSEPDLDAWDIENAEQAQDLRFELWEEIQQAFVQEYKRTWQEDLGLAMFEDQFEGMTESNRLLICSLRFDEQGTQRQYSATAREAGKLEEGAESHRRYHVPMRVWVDRVRKYHSEALVGIIAEKVWSMPIREIVG